jgi:hypothetical protein
MKFFTSTVLPIGAATLWISISEFFRNEILLKSFWVRHYDNLGIEFPSEPVNGAIWGLWSLLFAVSIFIVSKKYSLLQTAAYSWFVGFVLMWVVIGNLGVLPYGLLLYALPLSLLESFVAAYIIRKLG